MSKSNFLQTVLFARKLWMWHFNWKEYQCQQHLLLLLDGSSVTGVGYQPGESVIFAAADEISLVVFSLCREQQIKVKIICTFISFSSWLRYTYMFMPPNIEASHFLSLTNTPLRSPGYANQGLRYWLILVRYWWFETWCISPLPFPGRRRHQDFKNVSLCFEAVVGIRKIIIVQRFNHLVPLFIIHSRVDFNFRIVVLSTLICRSMKCFSLSIWNWEFNTNVPCSALKFYWKNVLGICV